MLGHRAIGFNPWQAVGDLGWFPIHRSRVVKNYLAAGAAERIQLERFPAYAPELNPDEGIWQYLKRVELKNVSCQTHIPTTPLNCVKPKSV